MVLIKKILKEGGGATEMDATDSSVGGKETSNWRLEFPGNRAGFHLSHVSS